MLRLTLVGRSYCSLCEDMRTALQNAARQQEIVIELTEVDLDEHPSHESKFGEWVPVLILGTLENGTEVCHYHFDEAKWHALLDVPFVIETFGRATSPS
ncbi:MAG: glutaredoxin family protein [Pseudomonadota bacterium]